MTYRQRVWLNIFKRVLGGLVGSFLLGLFAFFFALVVTFTVINPNGHPSDEAEALTFALRFGLLFWGFVFAAYLATWRY